MYIKTLITGLMLSMLLSSGAANADWGDVYYCQMTNFNGITLEGEQINFKLEMFQFKLDQTKNAMVFGSTGYFTDSVAELNTGMSYPNIEIWHSNNKYKITNFEDGNFLYGFVFSNGIKSISAVCDKF